MKTLQNFCILLGVFALSQGYESEGFEPFIASIIEKWKLISPTIIYKDDMPDMCINHPWLLCITNDADDKGLANHLKSIDIKGNQDGLILVGIEGHKKLLKDLSKVVPTILTTNYPVFMPLS